MCPRQDSNLRPSVPETGALSPELRRLGDGQVSSAVVRDDAPVREFWTSMRSNIALVSARYRASRINLAVAGVSYFIFMSLVPIAIAIGSFAGLFLSRDQISSAWSEIQKATPDSLEALKPSVDSLVQLIGTASAGSFTITTIITTAIAVYAASKVVLGTRTALADTYGVPLHTSGLIDRAASALVALIGVTLIVAVLILLTIVPQVLSGLGLGATSFLDNSPALSGLVAIVMVYLVARWLVTAVPGGRIPSPFLSWGAGLATIWIVCASFGFGVYASWSSTVSSAVLVFGTPIALLLWIYLVTTGIMLGAVIHAVSITKKTSVVAQQSGQ
jgi:membrane protein